jgi:membrane protease YdiL (CAAX protease family)
VRQDLQREVARNVLHSRLTSASIRNFSRGNILKVEHPAMSAEPAERLLQPIRTRELSGTTIALFLALTFAVLTAYPLIRHTRSMARVVLPAWLDNLVPFGTLLVVAVGGVLFLIGRLRASDLQLQRSALAIAALTIGLVWLINQVIGAATSLLTIGTIAIDQRWTTPGVGPTLLWTVVMLFGTALFEEIAFRGMLYPQLVLKLRKVTGANATPVVAALLSQLVFAVSHLPGHVVIRHTTGGALLVQLALQMVAGILLLLVYLRTRNLWIAVGLHALADAPAPLVQGTLSWEVPLLVLLIAWPWLVRRSEQRGLAPIEAAGQPG